MCPYDNCNRTYLFKSNLDQHIKTVHEGKRYYCDICSAGLTAKIKLIEHIQRHCESTRRKLNEEQRRRRKNISEQKESIITMNEKQRKKRKDAGKPKKSVITKLIGINLPTNLENKLLKREAATDMETS